MFHPQTSPTERDERERKMGRWAKAGQRFANAEQKDYQAAERGLVKLYVERWKLSEKLRDEEVMAKAWEETQKEVEERRRRADTTMEPGPRSAY
jgi:hypothetical protein